MRMGIGLGIGINRSNYAQGIFNAYQSRVIADGGVTEAGGCVDAVSSLLQSASLLLIPSGYKSGKAYAQIPTNGNGDLTWTRASDANRTNSSGNIELMASGVPRLSYMYGSCPALLLEPQRTNLALRSEEFDNAVWLKLGGSSVTANTTTAPDGTTTADTLSLTTNASSSVAQSIVFATTTTITISVYAKVSSGTKDFRLRTDNPTTTQAFTATTSWQRFSMTATPTGTTSAYVINNLAGTAGDLIIWGFQVEVGSYPTTYIPTTTASATRIADSFSRNNIYTNGLITSSGGTWFVELRNNVALTRDASGSELYIGEDATSGLAATKKAILIRNSGGAGPVLLSVTFWDGTSLNSLYITTTSTVKLAIKFNGTTADIFANGTKVVTSASVALTLANMQHLNALSGVPRFIQQMALYPTPLSDTDCTTITTL